MIKRDKELEMIKIDKERKVLDIILKPASFRHFLHQQKLGARLKIFKPARNAHEDNEMKRESEKETV